MSRKRHEGHRLHIILDGDIYNRLAIMGWDPVRGKPKHGVFSDLINKLLRQHLRTIPSTGLCTHDFQVSDDGETIRCFNCGLLRPANGEIE